MPILTQIKQTNSRLGRASVLLGVSVVPISSILADDPKPATKTRTITEFTQVEVDELKWRVVDDGVMGGLSKGKLSTTEEGTVRFEGTLSLENNGGFSSIRTARMSPMDLSTVDGLVVRVKGDGRTYQMRLEADARYRGAMTVSFKADFATKKGEWVEVRVPFDAFEGGWRGRALPDKKLNSAKVERIGVVLADKNPGAFALELDWIRTFKGQGGR